MKKTSPIKIEYYKTKNLSKIMEKQAIDMMEVGKYIYVLPCVADCVAATNVISAIEKMSIKNLFLVDAFSHGSRNYHEIEEKTRCGYTKRDHIILITTEHFVTGCMLRKFKGWNIVFHGIPKLSGEESISLSPISKKWLSEFFEIGDRSEGSYKISDHTKFSRTSITRDGIAVAFARLHKFAVTRGASCKNGWKSMWILSWSWRWSRSEIDHFKSATLYVENSSTELVRLEEFMAS